MIEWSHSSWQKHSSICTCCLIQIQRSIFCRRCVIYLLHKTSHLLLPLTLEPFLANSTYSTQKRTLSRFLINKGAVLSLKQNWKSWVLLPWSCYFALIIRIIVLLWASISEGSKHQGQRLWIGSSMP